MIYTLLIIIVAILGAIGLAVALTLIAERLLLK